MQTARPLRIFAAILAAACLLDSAQAAQKRRNPETLRVGDWAPEFSLKSPNGENTVQLSDYRGAKPVVLIFGSYTCPPFRDVYPTLERLHREYGSEVAFLYVYIREAHPEDGWKMPRNQREGIAVKDPKSMAERADLTKQACAFFKTSIPAVVDTMDDATDRAYAAWPSRIYLLSVDGKVAVCGNPGPRGLVPAAREVETWLKDHREKRATDLKR